MLVAVAGVWVVEASSGNQSLICLSIEHSGLTVEDSVAPEGKESAYNTQFTLGQETPVQPLGQEGALEEEMVSNYQVFVPRKKSHEQKMLCSQRVTKSPDTAEHARTKCAW